MGRRRNRQRENWRKIFLSLLIIICLYFIFALFGSSLVGNSGEELGFYLRTAWGGAVVVPLLFWLYLCVAKLMKLRVPFLPRQILGTIQLYISFAFMLGLLKETGWNSELTLFLPGNFGRGLAHFFYLNIGGFLTLLFVIGSFILSAFFFGSRVLTMQFPEFSFNALKRQKKSENINPESNPRRRRRPVIVNENSARQYSSDRPEDILFMKNLPEPQLKVEEDFSLPEVKKNKSGLPDFPRPKLKADPEPVNDLPDSKQGEEVYNDEDFYSEGEFNIASSDAEKPNAPENNYAVEIIDNLLASLDSGAMSMPESKRSKTSQRSNTRKFRRPLPAVNFNEGLENLIPNENFDFSSEISQGFPPPLEFFGSAPKFEIARENLKISDKTGKTIISTLKNFGVNASIAETFKGASVTQYLIELAPGMKVNQVSDLDEELAMSLAVMSVRIEAPILGTRYVGIEVPNPERKKISLRSVFESDEFQDSSARLPVPLGVQFDGKFLIKGLEELSNLLVAGGKDSGKNTFLNTSIISMCSRRRPEELQLILIDPRHVEFAVYEGLPHLLIPPIFNHDDSLKALQWAFDEMESRTANFAKNRVRTLSAYNRKLAKKDRLPEIVIVISELADLMYQSGSDGNEFEDLIVRLAQKSSAAGIYMIIASQRPSADVVTTLIRSNISARAAFALSSPGDSKNIIGITDAEKLTGRGDMLFRDGESPRAIRLQAPFIAEEKISEFVEYLEEHLPRRIENSNFEN